MTMNRLVMTNVEWELYRLVIKKTNGITFSEIKGILRNRRLNPEMIDAEINGISTKMRFFKPIAEFDHNNVPKYMDRLVKKGFIKKIKEPFEDSKKRKHKRIRYLPVDISKPIRFFLYNKGFIFDKKQFNNINPSCHKRYRRAYVYNSNIAKQLFDKDPIYLTEYITIFEHLYKLFLTDESSYRAMIANVQGFHKRLIKSHHKMGIYLDIDQTPISKIEKVFNDFYSYMRYYCSTSENTDGFNYDWVILLTSQEIKQKNRMGVSPNEVNVPAKN